MSTPTSKLSTPKKGTATRQLGPARRISLRRALTATYRSAFAIFIILALGTHSGNGRVGPFSWLPLLRLPSLTPDIGGVTRNEQPVVVGLLALLPLVIVTAWVASRLLTPPQARRPWSWGRPAITLPLLGLTLLGLLTPFIAPPQWWNRTAVIFALAGVAVTWALYLFVVNDEPDLWIPLAFVLIIQGSVAVGQFLRQGDLGLTFLGELSLDPQRRGASVLMADGQRWLRGYGLTGHPNLVGAILAALNLLLLPKWQVEKGGRRVLLGLALIAGHLGLLATVSRAAWLAYAAALLFWLATSWWVARTVRRHGRGSRSVDGLHALRRFWPIALLVGAGALLLLIYGDVILSRFLDLNSSVEARSLAQRASDNAVALRVIVARPWGVGLGNYLPAARELWAPARVVHNVPLLVTAELGWPGGLIWLWLALAPLVWLAHDSGPGRQRSLALLPAWLASLAIGLFHNLPWITTSWRTAILIGLLAGLWGQQTGRERKPGNSAAVPHPPDP